jgi:hypothetical protein
VTAPRWRRLPEPARTLAASASGAVHAAAAGDSDAFEAATARLAAQDPEHVRVVLGAVVRSLLEQAHPDGVDGDDVAAVVERCARAAAWCEGVDPEVLVLVLAGALGVHEDEPRSLPPAALARHAALLGADLLTAAPGGHLDGLLDAALAEVARVETVEMP